MTVAGLIAETADTILPEITDETSTALIQYTSGSTGDPKGVVLSHANLIANIRALGVALAASSADVFVSWLPLYHDLGLIGAWLGCLYFAAPLYVMSPLSFLVHPESWLWAIHRFRGTLSAAPNFAFELCLTEIDTADLAGLDLSFAARRGQRRRACLSATRCAASSKNSRPMASVLKRWRRLMALPKTVSAWLFRRSAAVL